MNNIPTEHAHAPLTFKCNILILLFFSCAAIIFTWPLIYNLEFIPRGDAAIFSHSFWVFKKSLFSLNNPFYTDYIFYPEGTSLAFQGATFSNFLITLPFNLLFSENVAVNIAFILTYILTAYFTFLLAHRMTGSLPAAMLAALIFSFNPYHYTHGVSHLNLTSYQWLPLYLLFLYNIFCKPSLRTSVWAGITLGVIILTDHFLTINAFLLTGLLFTTIISYTLITGPPGSSHERVRLLLGCGLVVFAVGCLVSGFYLYQVLFDRFNAPDMLKFDIFGHGGANMFSGDLAGYLFPPSYHPFWGGLFPNKGVNGEQVAFLGFIPLALACMAALYYRTNKTVLLVIVISILFWILSLGVTLHINGVWEWKGVSYKLPFYYLSGLPIIGEIRTPVRFILITYLGIALLSAYSFSWIMGRIREQKFVVVMASLIFIAVSIEYLPAYPYHVEKTTVPAIYEKIALDSEPYAILELPLSRWYGIYKNGSGNPTHIMSYQLIHNKKIFNGLVTRTTPDRLQFKDEISSYLTDLTAYENYKVVVAEKRQASEMEVEEARTAGRNMSFGKDLFFKRLNVKYILIHPPISYQGSMTRAFVEALTGLQPQMLNSDGIVFYEVDL